MKKLLILLVMAAASLALNATDSHVTVSGYISNSDGDAISGVTVKCLETGSTSEKTGLDGFYAVSVQSGRQNTLRLSHSTYKSPDVTVQSSTSDIEDFDITMSR